MRINKGGVGYGERRAVVCGQLLAVAGSCVRIGKDLRACSILGALN